MSRIGNKIINVPSGVSVTINGNAVGVRGPKGKLSWEHPQGIHVEQDGETLRVTRDNNEKDVRAFHGLTRSLVANMVQGVDTGYQKWLELHGVGYRASVQGTKVELALGFSHPIHYTAPDGITIEAKSNTLLLIEGPDKQLVGQVAALLRSYSKAEPYKGKGVRYQGEHVRRKAGKTVA